MPQSKKKVEQLMDQYPFLREVRYWATKVDERLQSLENVTVTVHRADPNLMFRQADNVPGMGRHYLMDREDHALKGVQTEYFYPVNRDGKLGELRTWDDWKSQYVRDLFNRGIRDWTDDPHSFHGERPEEVIEHVVWVASTVWYRQDDDHDFILNGEGEPVRVDIELTVYREPKEGWRQLYIDADPQVNVVLAGSRLWPSPELSDSFRAVIYDRLGRLAMRFEEEVFKKGLWNIINRSRKKGMSGQFGDVKVLSYVIGGRVMIQLEQGRESVTFVGVEEVRANFGFSSISGTLPCAVEMVEKVIEFWREASPEERDTVHNDDTEVGMGF